MEIEILCKTGLTKRNAVFFCFVFLLFFFVFFPVCLFPISGGPNTDVSQHIGEDKYISKTGHGPFSGRTGGAVY